VESHRLFIGLTFSRVEAGVVIDPRMKISFEDAERGGLTTLQDLNLLIKPSGHTLKSCFEIGGRGV
jgi:hypothetical protein